MVGRHAVGADQQDHDAVESHANAAQEGLKAGSLGEVVDVEQYAPLRTLTVDAQALVRAFDEEGNQPVLGQTPPLLDTG